MIECIGIQEKKGTFVPDGKTETVSFDNVMIYYITDDNPDIVGYFGKELKCKNSKVRKINFDEWSEIIGKEIIFHYNIFGANPVLDGVQIVAEGKVTSFLSHLSDTKKS